MYDCHWTSLMISQIGSGYGLVPSGNKPLPEPMMIQISLAIWVSLDHKLIKQSIKQMGNFCQNAIWGSNVILYKCDISVWDWPSTMNVWSALWLLMVWCLGSRASVATVLSEHLCISRHLEVNTLRPEKKMMPSWRQHFAMYSLEIIFLYFDRNFTQLKSSVTWDNDIFR